MRTPEERVAVMHSKMTALRQTRERRKTAALEVLGVTLTLSLAVLIFGRGQPLGSGPGSAFSGSMLFENAGGYVLTAIVAFMVGMAATLLGLQWRDRKRQAEQPQDPTQTEETQDTEDPLDSPCSIPQNGKEEV